MCSEVPPSPPVSFEPKGSRQASPTYDASALSIPGSSRAGSGCASPPMPRESCTEEDLTGSFRVGYRISSGAVGGSSAGNFCSPHDAGAAMGVGAYLGNVFVAGNARLQLDHHASVQI